MAFDSQLSVILVSVLLRVDNERVAYLGMLVRVSDLDAVTVPLEVLVGILTDALTVFVPSEL